MTESIKTKPTKVIFRKWPKKEGGAIIALFPEIAADWKLNCLSYQHVGQHGAASPRLMSHTREATPEEYASLKSELEGNGYILSIVRRFTTRDYAERKGQLNLISKP